MGNEAEGPRCAMTWAERRAKRSVVVEALWMGRVEEGLEAVLSTQGGPSEEGLERVLLTQECPSEAGAAEARSLSSPPWWGIVGEGRTSHLQTQRREEEDSDGLLEARVAAPAFPHRRPSRPQQLLAERQGAVECGAGPLSLSARPCTGLRSLRGVAEAGSRVVPGSLAWQLRHRTAEEELQTDRGGEPLQLLRAGEGRRRWAVRATCGAPLLPPTVAEEAMMWNGPECDAALWRPRMVGVGRMRRGKGLESASATAWLLPPAVEAQRMTRTQLQHCSEGGCSASSPLQPEEGARLTAVQKKWLVLQASMKLCSLWLVWMLGSSALEWMRLVEQLQEQQASPPSAFLRRTARTSTAPSSSASQRRHFLRLQRCQPRLPRQLGPRQRQRDRCLASSR
jgi:hypothetical protein